MRPSVWCLNDATIISVYRYASSKRMFDAVHYIIGSTIREPTLCHSWETLRPLSDRTWQDHRPSLPALVFVAMLAMRLRPQNDSLAWFGPEQQANLDTLVGCWLLSRLCPRLLNSLLLYNGSVTWQRYT